MEETNNQVVDFKKWILFNNRLSDFQGLYDLYLAIDLRQSKGSVIIEKNGDDSGLLISQEGHEPVLELRNEGERTRFLGYLVQHYFPNTEIEEWYQAKVEEKGRSENHALTSNGTTKNHIRPGEFKVHPKEVRYYQFRIIVSICFYLAVAATVANSFAASMMAGAVSIISLLMILLFVIIVRTISHGIFIGLIKGSSVKLNEHQYPEIYKIVELQAKEIGLETVPDVYVSGGHFNAFVTRFARRNFLMLYSEVLETATRGDLDVVRFVVGHELAHLKRRHLSTEKWLIPSLLVPFLRQAHSRACEYTCDRIGYHFSSKGAYEGILIIATGKAIYSKINIGRYIDDSNAESGFWVWFSEKFLSHPHTFKRISAIKNYSERGY